MKELLSDAWTVTQKDVRELLATRSRSPLSVTLIACIVLVLGVLLPLRAGPHWLERGWLLSLWAWVPVFLVASVIADTVAGERERHTFETLLASRLPDRAILLGKVAAAVIYGWGLMLITILLSVVVINLVFAREALLLYRPTVLIGGALLSLLTAVLTASFGLLVSLRASSVRRAQQIIARTLLAVLALHIMAMPLLMRLLTGHWQLPLVGDFAPLNQAALVAGMALLLIGLNAALFTLAAVRFQRYRLHVL